MLKRWEACPEELLFDANDVHVWRIPLLHDEDFARFWQILNPKEKKRAEAFKTSDLRRRYVIAHGAMREILSGYLGVLPKDLQIVDVKNKKPYVATLQNRLELDFSLSHSHELAVLGVSRFAKIGVDVEYVRVIDDVLSLAERFFAMTEYEALKAVSKAERLDLFFRQWTAKEAYLKAIGLGLAANLKNFSIKCAHNEGLAIEFDHVKSESWCLRVLPVDEGYVSSVAANIAKDMNLRCFAYLSNTIFRCRSD